MSLADNPYIGVEPRYNVLKRQGYLGLILEKDLVFYKVDDKKKRLQSMPLLTRDKIIFSGELGENDTGATVGAFEVGKTNYITAGVNQGKLFVATVPKDNFEEKAVTIKYLKSNIFSRPCFS